MRQIRKGMKLNCNKLLDRSKYFIYKLEHKSGKTYVGVTNSLETRMSVHIKYFSNIVKCNKRKNWTVKILKVVKVDSTLTYSEARKIVSPIEMDFIVKVTNEVGVENMLNRVIRGYSVNDGNKRRYNKFKNKLKG